MREETKIRVFYAVLWLTVTFGVCWLVRDFVKMLVWVEKMDVN